LLFLEDTFLLEIEFLLRGVVRGAVEFSLASPAVKSDLTIGVNGTTDKLSGLFFD